MEKRPIIVFDMVSLKYLSAPIQRNRYSLTVPSEQRAKYWLDLLPAVAKSDAVERIVLPDVIVFEATGQIFVQNLGQPFKAKQIDSQYLQKGNLKNHTFEAINGLVKSASYRGEGFNHEKRSDVEVRETSYDPFKGFKLKANRWFNERNHKQLWERASRFRGESHGENAAKFFLCKKMHHHGPVYFVSDDHDAVRLLSEKQTRNGSNITAITTLDFLSAVLQGSAFKEQLGVKAQLFSPAVLKDMRIFSRSCGARLNVDGLLYSREILGGEGKPEESFMKLIQPHTKSSLQREGEGNSGGLASKYKNQGRGDINPGGV